ncbi:hypothetical protein ACLQ2E_36285, partial [Streptomyces lavendulocolor]
RAVEAAGAFGEGLPRPGERVAVAGCGTSWFMAIAYAALREAAGAWTEAYPAREYRHGPISITGQGPVSTTHHTGDSQQ